MLFKEQPPGSIDHPSFLSVFHAFVTLQHRVRPACEYNRELARSHSAVIGNRPLIRRGQIAGSKFSCSFEQVERWYWWVPGGI